MTLSFRTKVATIASALMLAAASAAAQTPATPEAQPPVPTVVAPATPPPAVPTIGPMREIRIGEHFALKLGLQAQVWADAAQDASPAMMAASEDGYQNGIFLKRARILLGAKPWDNVDLFVLVEGSNLGKATGVATAPKNNNPIAIVDAYGEIKFHDALIVTVGLQLVPLARNILQATTTYLTLDTGNTSVQSAVALQTQTLRDVGLQVKGTVFDDKLEYRAGVWSGIREPAVTVATDTQPMSTASENAPRFAGYLQYNFLDADKGYVFNGTYYGKKNILGLSVGGDYQKGTGLEAYRAFSAAAFAALPIFGKNAKTGADEIGALAQFIHYNGMQTAPTLLEQNDFLGELAYYNKATKLSVFGKFEGQWFVDNNATPADETLNNKLWFGGGVKYNLIENLCNFTLAYNRMQMPNAPTDNGIRNFTNQFTFAAQVLYY